MPELVGKWYSKIPSSPKVSAAVSSEKSSSAPEYRWCYCKGDDVGEMIFCEGESCLIKWFHASCLKISRIPKGKWYCPDCRKSRRR